LAIDRDTGTKDAFAFGVRAGSSVSIFAAVLVLLSHGSRAYDYLLLAIQSARSLDELARMLGLARVHYSGVLLAELEAQVAARRRVLAAPESRLDAR
jgi:hypothetical protein